jgi:mannose-6-phosphate isomerase class I
VNSSDEEFIQPSDEDAQGNVLAEEELTSIKMNDAHRTPSKKIVNRQHNPNMMIALRRLSKTKKDSINEIMNRKT